MEREISDYVKQFKEIKTIAIAICKECDEISTDKAYDIASRLYIAEYAFDIKDTLEGTAVDLGELSEAKKDV